MTRSSRLAIGFGIAVVALACGVRPGAPVVVAPPSSASAPPPAVRVPAACPAGAVASPSLPARPPKQIIEQRQNDRIESLAFTPDGRTLAAASAARVVSVWNVRDRALLRTLRVPGILPPIATTWNASGDALAIGQNASILVDAAREKVIGTFLDNYGSESGSKLRSVPGRKGQAWIGIMGSSIVLFDDERKPAVTLPWPAGTTSASSWVKEIAVSSDGRVAVAAAASKGLFVWDLAKAGTEAKSYAIDGDAIGVAVTPRGDRALVATRPKTGESRVDIVDVATGRVTSALAMDPESAKSDWLTSIALSADGETAVAGSLHRVTAWAVATGARRWVVDADRVVVRSRHDLQSIVQAVAFSPTEPLVAAGNARGDVFFLDARSGRLTGELGVAARRPDTLVFSDDNRSLLAIGGDHATKWSIDEGRLAGAHYAPGAAAASRLPKGELAIGRAPLLLQFRMPTDPPPACADGAVPIYVAPWSDADELASIPGFVSRGVRVVSGAAPAPPERVAPPGPLCVPRAFALYDLNAQARRALVQLQGDGLAVVGLSDKRATALDGSKDFAFAAKLSPDARRACASNLQRVSVWDTSTGAAQTSIALGGFGGSPPATAFSPDGTRLAIANGLVVEMHALPSGDVVWRGSVNQPLVAIAFAGDGRDVLVGSFTGSVAFIHEGQVASVLDGGAGGGVGALAVSPDGSLVASSHQDGAVRVWDAKKKALRATMVDFDDDEWVIATPGGAFTGTDEVSQRIGWVFESPLARFGFEQFASRFRDAAVVRNRLATGEGDVAEEVRRPPSLEVVGEPTRGGGKARVCVRATSATRVDAVLAFREGRPVDTRSVCKADGEVTFELPELGGENRFTFSAVDDRGVASNPLTVDVRAPGGARPDIWIVGIGVSAYPKLSEQEQLHVAHVDAKSVVAAFADQAGAGRAFAKPHPTLLLEGDASVKAIRDALAGLSAMAPDDLAVVFLAGHGIKISESSDTRFLTRNSDASPASIAVDGIGWSEIAEKLAAARGRVLLLLDACHSGHLSQDLVVPNGALAATLSKQGRAGVLVFAAAKGRQESLEDREHGFFTRAILDTLADANADRDHDGRLQVYELIDAVTVRVDAFTRGRQTPWVTRREVFGDFQVAAPQGGK